MILTIKFIGKVLLLSTVLALGIHYSDPILKIAPTIGNAALGVAALPVMVGLALWWRYGNYN